MHSSLLLQVREFTGPQAVAEGKSTAVWPGFSPGEEPPGLRVLTTGREGHTSEGQGRWCEWCQGMWTGEAEEEEPGLLRGEGELGTKTG